MAVWLSRDQALALLHVRAQTLYAYISRGRIAARPDPADPRKRQYSSEDIEALTGRRARGKRPDRIAASTIAWGEPIIATAISTVRQGRLSYRGHDAVTLAQTASLEDAASLLWASARRPAFAAPSVSSLPAVRSGGIKSKRSQITRAQGWSTLADAAAQGAPILGATQAALHREGAALVGRLAAAFGAAPGRGALHRRLAAGWGGGHAAAEAIRRALVLLADQELSTSVFAARVTASTGAALGACVLAGFAALSGPLHGNATGAVQELFAEIARTGIDATLARRREAALPIPGFGHRLYPAEGDPRAPALLAAVAIPEAMRIAIARLRAATGEAPTIDVALVALARSFALPCDAPFALFAIARSIGWVAHAIEQAGAGTLIRPRARYVGRAMGEAATSRRGRNAAKR